MAKKIANNRGGNEDAATRDRKISDFAGIKLIIGLGNPSREYQNTYHNIGLSLADYLNEHLTNSRFAILKSDVFMNESGKYVKKIAKKYKAKPEEILIAHDDSDIILGKYKLSFGRGSAGHKGAQSIVNTIGTKNFWRLRIGIRPESEKRRASFFVLKKIKPSEQKKISSVFEKILGPFGV